MGLDMWMIEVKKMTKKETAALNNMTYEEISDLPDFSYYIKEEVDEENTEFLEDLMPYTITVPVNIKYYDMEKIKEDYNIPEEAWQYKASYSKDGVEYGYCFSDHRKKDITIKLTNEEIEKYIVSKPRHLIVYKRKEVAYWRKFYELQDLIYDMYREYRHKEIQNCGMHVLSDDMLNEISKMCRKYDYKFNKPRWTKSNAFFYHEWY